MNKFSQNTTYFNFILLRKLELYRLRFFSIIGNFEFKLFILTLSQEMFLFTPILKLHLALN